MAEKLGSDGEVIGIELFSRSDTYGWDTERGTRFTKVTLFPDKSSKDVSALRIVSKILSVVRQYKLSRVVLCHYDMKAIFAAAVVLRLWGRTPFMMGCSKFDDYERTLWRELAKSLFVLPYKGGLSSGRRARDYMRFLGLPSDRIETEYNTVSTDRIRTLARAAGHTPYPDKDFVIIARLVPKKNLSMAIEAFRIFTTLSSSPADLHICGSGPLESALKSQVETLGLKDRVHFHGFVQTEGVAQQLSRALALLLPSTEEQFGNVVIEALALGIPAIISDNCGARDVLVRNWQNGFIIEPDNPTGLAHFMQILAQDEQNWQTMSEQALASSKRGDVSVFAEGIQRLVSR